MDRRITTNATTPHGGTVRIWCGCCQNVTHHQILASVKTGYENADGESFSDDYLTVQCLGCETVAYCIQASSSLGQETDPETGDERIAVETRKVYPLVSRCHPMMPDAEKCPEPIYRLYHETSLAISNDLLFLGGVGIRMIVEAVCKEKNAQGENLKDRINDFVDRQLISREEGAILQTLRVMGNDTVHDAIAHSAAHLAKALEVVEHLLRTVYILPEIGRTLPKKQAKA